VRKLPWLLSVLLAVAAVLAVRAEDNAPKKDEAKKEDAKKEDTKKDAAKEAAKDAAAPAGAQQSLKGDLGISSDGKTVLRVKEEKSPVKTYILWPDASVAKSLADLAKKKALAEVTGTVAPDGVNVKVSAVSEEKREKAKGGGGKH